MNSRIHRGATITCPFCKHNYTTASGLAHHLESGSCSRAPQLNRESIHKIIRQKDPHGLITNKQLGTSAKYSATSQAFNGRWWECYICHREFSNDSALNQHLNSPVHQQKVYHCPNRRCGKEFTALAGLFRHLESEACAFMRFEKVQTQVSNVLNSNRLIAFN